MKKHVPILLPAILSFLAFVVCYYLLGIVFPPLSRVYYAGLFSLILFLMLEDYFKDKHSGT